MPKHKYLPRPIPLLATSVLKGLCGHGILHNIYGIPCAAVTILLWSTECNTCLSRHCCSLSCWMLFSCSGLIPFHLSGRTCGGLPPPTCLSVASAHSVIMSDVIVCHISARFSCSSLLRCSSSFSACSLACVYRTWWGFNTDPGTVNWLSHWWLMIQKHCKAQSLKCGYS